MTVLWIGLSLVGGFIAGAGLIIWLMSRCVAVVLPW